MPGQGGYLVSLLTESALLGRLLGAGVCHAHSLTQAGKIGQRLWISNSTTAGFRISLRDEIQFCYTKQDAFATVCSLRGGHFFRPDSSPPFLPAVLFA